MRNTEKHKHIEQQKFKLEQKKNRLLAEETRLKNNERKLPTRHLIEVGGLVVKAGLDHLPTNTLYGALLSLATTLETDKSARDEWTRIGKAKFEQEERLKHKVILTFEQQPSSEIRQIIRNHGLKWNRVRSEWYGEVSDIDALKGELDTTEYKVEQI